MLVAKLLAVLARKATAAYQSARPGFTSPSYQPLGPSTERHHGRARRTTAALAIALLVFCWLLRFCVVADDPFVVARRNLTKEQYIDAVMREPIEGLLNVEPIQRKCQQVKLMPGLVWHCDFLQGGLGNVGNQWLNCMLFGIEAGAPTIILPRVAQRDDNNLVDMGDRSRTGDLSILYDTDYFKEAWAEACPQIRLVTVDDPEARVRPHKSLQPFRIPGLEKVRHMVVDPVGWRAGFEGWLKKYFNESANMSADKPIRVICMSSLFGWNRATRPLDFAYSFARLFRFRTEMRRLGAAALWSLEQRLGRPVVSDAVLFPALTAKKYASSSSPPRRNLLGMTRELEPTVNRSLVTSLGRHRLVPDAFMGAHLRADSDSLKVGWPGYEYQAPVYFEEALKRNLSTVYLAAGTPDSAKRFVDDAASRGLTVYSKEDLLDAGEQAAMRNLTWDQRAVVDFQVLLYAGYFTGYARSTFSVTTAIRRTSLPEAGPWIINSKRDVAILEERAKAPAKEPANFEAYRDSLSRVICGLPDHKVDAYWP